MNATTVKWVTTAVVLGVAWCSLAAEPTQDLRATNDRARVPDGPLEIPVPAPPADRRNASNATAAVAPITRGRFTSFQINTDANGDDILNDAANEPSMAVDPNDRNKIAIGWRQFDTIADSFRQAGVAYSQDGGATWTFPGVLDPGQFRSDPVLSSDANGNFYYSSLSAIDSAEMFKSIDGGMTWSAPVSAFGGDKQWIAVDATASAGAGFIYQIWNMQFSCCGVADFTRSINGGASFNGPFALATPSMKWGTLNVGPDGELYAAGTTLNQTSHLIARSDNARDGAFPPTFGTPISVNLGGVTQIGPPNPQGLLGQIWVATDHTNGATRGNVYMLATVDPPGADPLDVHVVRSEDGGLTWSAPLRVNDDATGTNAVQWMGTMSVAPNGRIDAVWLDSRNDATPANPSTSELYFSYSLDAGQTWAPGEALSPAFDHSLGYPQQSKMGDYYHMISFDDEVFLAYCATFTGGQDVYFIRYSPICPSSGCLTALEPLPESGGVAKNRYLSIVPRNAAGMTALRVTLATLSSPFETFEGETRWVGDPQSIQDTPTPGATFFKAAPLVCDPVYRDWGAEGLIHVFSDAIVPGAEYSVQALFDDCDINLECDYSPSLGVTTQSWGDVVAPFGGGQPDFVDISAVVSKFSDESGAITKPRADLNPNVPDATVDFTDISDDVAAFSGESYPYLGPSVCP